MTTGFSEFFREKRGGPLSSARLVGVSCGFTLVIVGLTQALSPYEVTMSDRLIEALEYITISCILWAQLGKFADRQPARTHDD